MSEELLTELREMRTIIRDPNGISRDVADKLLSRINDLKTQHGNEVMYEAVNTVANELRSK